MAAVCGARTVSVIPGVHLDMEVADHDADGLVVTPVERGFVREAARDTVHWVADVPAAFDVIERGAEPPTRSAAPDEILEAER